MRRFFNFYFVTLILIFLFGSPSTAHAFGMSCEGFGCAPMYIYAFWPFILGGLIVSLLVVLFAPKGDVKGIFKIILGFCLILFLVLCLRYFSFLG